MIASSSASLARPSTSDELRETLLTMLASPALCSRKFITEQYDRYVRGNTVLAEHADSGVVRIDEETGLGIALATDASGRYTYLDPYRVPSSRSPRPTAMCRSPGPPEGRHQLPQLRLPEDPAVMWQFQQAVRGLADGCAQLGIPVTGGNVSFYNQTGSTRSSRHPSSACWA